MEAKLHISIPCPTHPTEKVQRVHLGLGAEKELYCIECLMSLTNPQSIAPMLKPFNEFLEMAVKFYSTTKKSGGQGDKIPSEYQKLLEEQSEVLSILTVHIEKEKSQVNSRFEDITHAILQVLSQKREEHIQQLDAQLNNMKNVYSFLEKQLNKLYGQTGDQDTPSR